jgi:CRP-like cAMP-binding protein
VTTGPDRTNAILHALPRKELTTLQPRLQVVPLPLHTVLNETARPIAYGYFINNGLASVLTVLKHNRIVEVGLTGSEGFVGLPLVAGFKSSAARVIVQIEGSALRIRANHLTSALETCPVLRQQLQGYGVELANQSAQIAACNRLHDVNQRMARWLLMSQDRLGGDLVGLTQEFLAHMLGMRRASVNVAIGFLQKAELIKYSRGAVKILDRAGLESATCECYSSIVRHHAMWRKESR